MTYQEKLKDPRWQKKRLEILQRDGFACTYCGDTRSTLHVHHVDYVGENPWDAPEDCLISLCEDCHSVLHLPLTELERYLLMRWKYEVRGLYTKNKAINSRVKEFKGRK